MESQEIIKFKDIQKHKKSREFSAFGYLSILFMENKGKHTKISYLGSAASKQGMQSTWSLKRRVRDSMAASPQAAQVRLDKIRAF